MRIKNYFLLFILITVPGNNIFSQNYWYRLESPTTQNLRAIFFTDSLNGWAAGDSGTIIRTTNGGENWIAQYDSVDHDIVDIFFLNDSIGWALGWHSQGTTILKTSNSGEYWEEIDFREENHFMKGIYFLDTLKGFTGGEPGGVRYTEDGGISWELAHIDSGSLYQLPVEGFKFFNDDYGYAYGGAIDITGVLWRTQNGGESWYSHAISSEPVFGLHFFDSLNVIGIMSDPDLFGTGIVRTNNAGDSWVFQRLEIFGISPALSFRNDREAWAVQPGEKGFLFSPDSGKLNTWQQIVAPDSVSLYNITFTDSIYGYAVGDNGVILKYIYNPVSVEENKVKNQPEDFVLYQNYPNPFNPVTEIQYSAGSRSLVKLKIYDALGKEIVTLVNEEKEPGIYTVKFNGAILSSGIYFYLLTATSDKVTFTETKKMILLK